MPIRAASIAAHEPIEPRIARDMKAALRHLDRAEEHLACLLLLALYAMLTAQIVFRFGFSMGFSWLEELSRIVFVWVIMLGAVVGMRRNLHIRVGLGLSLLPPALRPAAEALGELLLTLFCLAIAWYGVELVLSTLRVEYRLAATGLSMFWAYLVVPVSFALQALRIVLRRLQGRRGAEPV